MKPLLACLPIALAAGMALAQAGQPGAHFIENWDLDGDGSVSFEEATQKRAELFTMFDQDGSGGLDRAEYDLFDQTRQADMKANAGGHDKGPMRIVNDGLTLPFNDTNGDGTVSRDEFLGRSGDWFEMIDRSGDGVVDSADFTRPGG